jgi:ABC-type transport system substrate-binding protein
MNGGCTKTGDDGNLMVYHDAEKDDAKTLDPANSYDTISLRVLPLIYEQLYQYQYLNKTYKLEPLLAADVPRYSKDRLTVTIPIKHGVKYQDDSCFKDTQGKGREVKARDFVYAFKRLALPSIQSQGFWIFDGKVKGINDFHDKLVGASKDDLDVAFNAPIEGMTALDDFTLQLKLIKPYPQLLDVLAMGFTSPLPEECVKVYADEQGNFSDHPIGTGPFILKDWKRGHRITLDRSPTFHPEFYPTAGAESYRKRGLLADAGKPLPFLDRIVFDIVKESQPRWLGFMRGTFDVLELEKDNFKEAMKDRANLAPELASKGVRVTIEPGTRIWYVSMNVKDKLLGENKYLRQAISASIDRTKWIDLFTNGTGLKMVNALPPGLPDRPDDSKIKYDYNPKLAKELLKKAGYPEGKGLPVINFDMRGADSIQRQLGDFFERQLGAVGIKINVIYNTFPAYLEKAKIGNLQLSYGGWSLDYPDPENIYQLLYGPNKAPGPNDAN